jgi:hypothetical protein
MTAPQLAALLIVANTSIFLAGRFGLPPSLGTARPSWLPPVWVRAALPLAVAGALWSGQSWAWWAAVAMSAGMLSWMGIASCLLALGGFFTKQPRRVALFGAMAALWAGALTLLLSA